MAALLRYLPIIIALVLLVAAVVDIVRIDPSRVRALPKGLWVIIAITIVIIGPILWFALGREPLEPRNHGRYRSVPSAPDDDPEFLRRLARVGSHTIRHADVLARIGGDEFALLLVEADGDIGRIAASVVDRLRKRFETRTASYGTSFSAGIAIAEPGESAEDVLARADAAMYREKHARRERRR